MVLGNSKAARQVSHLVKETSLKLSKLVINKKDDQIITLKNTIFKNLNIFYNLILKIEYILDQYLADL